MDCPGRRRRRASLVSIKPRPSLPGLMFDPSAASRQPAPGCGAKRRPALSWDMVICAPSAIPRLGEASSFINHTLAGSSGPGFLTRTTDTQRGPGALRSGASFLHIAFNEMPPLPIGRAPALHLDLAPVFALTRTIGLWIRQSVLLDRIDYLPWRGVKASGGATVGNP
jgi:hypothetical protein